MSSSSHVKTWFCSQCPSINTVAVQGAVMKCTGSAGPGSPCPVQGLFNDTTALTRHLPSVKSQVGVYEGSGKQCSEWSYPRMWSGCAEGACALPRELRCPPASSCLVTAFEFPFPKSEEEVRFCSRSKKPELWQTLLWVFRKLKHSEPKRYTETPMCIPAWWLFLIGMVILVLRRADWCGAMQITASCHSAVFGSQMG